MARGVTLSSLVVLVLLRIVLVHTALGTPNASGDIVHNRAACDAKRTTRALNAGTAYARSAPTSVSKGNTVCSTRKRSDASRR